VNKAALLAALLAAGAAEAQMYKCVGARGVTQYSDKPCPDGRGGEVEIRGQPPISGKVTPYREDLKAAERDFQKREAQRERERQADAKALETRKRRCSTLQAQLQRANSVRRPADSVAHDTRIAELNADIARTCQ
jgi:hypothetical protein